jgi:hypothetical protein
LVKARKQEKRHIAKENITAPNAFGGVLQN